MTPTEKRNENIKLIANWLNTVATAILTIGAFVPIANFVFEILPKGTNETLVFAAAGICIVLAVSIHFSGHMVLRKLQ
ncbi:hypothetical protein ACQR16_08255 [Bradyrhizobium oligotrophicum]|uniref:hypothetical protein n=1 Tax=Bradyrhizobium oligotrophicum TaxID=44255 RepID=UPI003EBE6A76